MLAGPGIFACSIRTDGTGEAHKHSWDNCQGYHMSSGVAALQITKLSLSLPMSAPDGCATTILIEQQSGGVRTEAPAAAGAQRQEHLGPAFCAP